LFFSFGAVYEKKKTAVLGALRAIPTVRGIALGAFGELGESINVLIQDFAHKGALKNPDKFGQITRQLMDKSTGG
jgi:hypothetical protein